MQLDFDDAYWGQNMLGVILMRVRDELGAESAQSGSSSPDSEGEAAPQDKPDRKRRRVDSESKPPGAHTEQPSGFHFQLSHRHQRGGDGCRGGGRHSE